MKTAICILLLAALSCNTIKTEEAQPAVMNEPIIAIPTAYEWQTGNTPEGKWRLIPAMPSDTAAGKIPFLNFILNGKRVTGNDGCNDFSGTFNINKNSLTFNQDFISTKMACPGYDEEAFQRNLLRTNSFEMNGDTLVLMVNKTPLSYWLKSK